MDKSHHILSASLEDYLEAIYLIIKEKKAVRAKDIAKRLGVSNASVTGALRTLSKRGLIHYAPYDVISLTEKGNAVAADIVKRHEILKEFFVKALAVSEELADEAACKMEHGIPQEIIERFVHFIKLLESCPLSRKGLLDDKKKQFDCGSDISICEHCNKGRGADGN